MIVILTEHDLDNLGSSREPKMNSLYFSSFDSHYYSVYSTARKVCEI